MIQIIGGGVGTCEGEGFRYREQYIQRPEPVGALVGKSWHLKENLMKGQDSQGW